ncbi:MAG: polymer-forming cytoskeletal protein [Alphaproteobacteria bacterium]|nr:polymer-forming cytoskeletal protein [Alphaproteobacteria bacterium]
MLAILLALSPAATAATTIDEEEVYTLPQGEILDDDLYVFAREIRIEGTVTGDVVAFGQLVTVPGEVRGDLIAGAQAVRVDGRIGDDLRAAGQAVQVSPGATVADHVVSAGYSVQVAEGAEVLGDAALAGYQVAVDGAVGGTLDAAAGAVRLAGHFGDGVSVEVGPSNQAPYSYAGEPPPEIAMPTVQPGLTVTDGARFDGPMRYRSPDPGRISQAAQFASPPAYTPDVDEPEAGAPQASPLGAMVGGFFRQVVAMGIVNTLLSVIAAGWLERVTGRLRADLARSGLRGLVAFFLGGVGLGLIPVVTIALAVMLGFAGIGPLVGATLGLGLLGVVAVAVGLGVGLALVGPAVTGLVALDALIEKAGAKPLTGAVRGLVAGVLIGALTGLPFVGGLIGVLAGFLGLGAIVARGPVRAAP